MINLSSSTKIYLATGHTDMRKGVGTLSLLADSLLEGQVTNGAMFIFRGKSATKIKIIWWDGQGFCLFYKALDSGKFPWPNTSDKTSISITKAQLSVLIEGVDWRLLKWSNPPERLG